MADGRQARTSESRFTKLNLTNGLTLIVDEHHTSKVAAVEVWLRAGSAQGRDPRLARLVQRLVLNGAKTAPHALERAVEAVGGSFAAWTSFDQTTYQVTVASRFFKETLAQVAGVGRALDFTEADLKREATLQREQERTTLDFAARQVSSALMATAFTQHPYRWSPSFAEDVPLPTRESVNEFFAEYYQPKNVVLVISGDVATSDLQSADLQKEVERLWPVSPQAQPKNFPQPVAAAEPPQETPRELTLPANGRQPSFAVGWHIPSLAHVDAPALDALAVVLGHGEGSRLAARLKPRGLKEKALVNEVTAFALFAKDPGLFSVQMSCGETNAKAAVAALVAEVYRLRSEVVSAGELAKAKHIILNDNFYGQQTAQGRASKIGFFLTASGNSAFEKRYFAAVAGLTPEDLLRVANRYLTVRNMSTVALFGKDKPASATAPVGAAGATGGAAGTLSNVPSMVAEAEQQERKLSQPASLPEPNAQGVYRVVLPSGAILLVQEDPKVPTVAVRATFVGGHRLESARNNGIATLVARVIGRSSQRKSSLEVRGELDSAGAQVEGFSGQNVFTLRGDFLASTFDAGLDLFAELLLQANFAKEDVERERTILLEEIRSRDENPSSRTFDWFLEALFDSPPFKLKALGNVETVSALRAEDLSNFYASHYPPQRAVFSVVGDVSAVHVVHQWQRLFAQKPLRTAAPLATASSQVTSSLVTASPATANAPKTIERFREQSQATAVIGFRGARLSDPDRAVLSMIGVLLNDKLASGAKGVRAKSFAIDGMEPGYFATYLSSSPDAMPAALETTKEACAALRDVPVAPETLNKAKNFLLGTQALSLETPGARAAAMAIAELFGLGFDHDTHYDEVIASVSPADVQRVAKSYLGASQAVVVTVLPKPKAKP